MVSLPVTVMPFPERSAITTAVAAPAFQSSSASRLYTVVSVALVPSLFNRRAKAALSVALIVMVNEVAEVMSTFDVSVSR